MGKPNLAGRHWARGRAAAWIALGVALVAACLLGRPLAAQEPAKDAPPFPMWPGPLVEVTLAEGQQKLRGYLLEYESGCLRLRTLDGQPDQIIQGTGVAGLRFIRPPPPKEAESKPADNEPRNPPDDKFPMRIPRLWVEAIERRAQRMLTDDERRRFEELLRPEHGPLTYSEAREFKELSDKMGLPDLPTYRRATAQAKTAFDEGKMDAFIEARHSALRDALTEEEKRADVFALLAAASLKKMPPEEMWRNILEDLMRGVPPEGRLRRMQELRGLFRGLFLRDGPAGDPRLHRPGMGGGDTKGP